MIKAPSVTSLTIEKLSANQAYITWDDVGENFFYFVELAETRTRDGEIIPVDELSWVNLGYTAEQNWFEDKNLFPEYYYKFRVAVAAEGFEQSKWVETEEFQTFKTNAYNFSMMREFNLANEFIKEKFTYDNREYVKFNTDLIQASLMKEDFVFSPEYANMTNISNYIVVDENFHEIQDHIEKVCTDINRTMLAEMNGVLYLFERFQPIVKVSNDKGQSWKAYKAFNDRVGNPVSRTCVYQSKTTTYVLGYDRIFYGRQASDTRWSADDVRFSDDTITFAKVGDENDLGFDVEVFGVFSRLTGDTTKYAEAMACSDDYLWVGAKDVIRRIRLKNTPVDTVQGSPTFGEKIFDPDVIRVTGNDKAVIQKMDVIDGKLLVFVTGEVKQRYQDPTKPENVVPSDDAGVYLIGSDGLSFQRVFGNTPQEREYIQHGFSNMSTNGDEVFISHYNHHFESILPDPETAAKYELGEAVKYSQEPTYLTDKKIHQTTFRASYDDLRVWELGPQAYYNEADYTWMRRNGVRVWITNDNRPLVVYPEVIYTQEVDTSGILDQNRVNREVYDKGTVTCYLNNVKFEGFKQYASGVMFHKNTGEIIGFYQFNYRVRDQVGVYWKPTNVAFVAELQNQVREVPWVPVHYDREQDPDLRPLLNKMTPDSFLLENENFRKFSEYYLQFLSDGSGTYYNKLKNLIKNKYPREKDAYEYLWSEMNKRNIYADKNKRDAVVRFFESRKSDFYSTKGVEASYKFLFKLLYNEDVEIEVESQAGLEYDIVVSSTNIDEDIVGRTIYTPTGRANVTYLEREYEGGRLRWRVTIHNLIGRFEEGQVIKSEKTAFEGMILVGVRGKELLSSSIDYINRSRSQYTMKIKSALPVSRYANDVMRFVHPVGFGFIGVTLLTMFINSGLSMKHTETIIQSLKNYKFDSGLPSVYPDRVADLDVDGNIKKDPLTGKALYLTSPLIGEEFPVPPEYDQENSELFHGLKSSERRFAMSPLFDQSAVTFSMFRELVDKRLKDNIGNPRDPKNPTQRKING